MAAERSLTYVIGFKDGIIRFAIVLLHPGKQCRPEVEAYPGVVVDDVGNSAFFVKDP
jgi:hypothetical protein